MRQKLKHLKLFEGYYVPGLGTMKDTLPCDNKTLNGLELYLEENGTVSVSWNGPGGKKEAFIIGVSMWKVALPVESQPKSA